MRPSPRAAALGLAALAVALPFKASAIELLPPCTKTGDCGLTDILIVFVNVAEWLLSIMGAVALLMFVIGGFYWVFSAGNPDKVKKGVETVRNSAIGIGIILLSGLIVRFTSNALTGGQSPIPVVGATCTTNGKSGLFISLPPGVDESGKVIPEEIICVAKDSNCAALNALLAKRSRREQYECRSVSDADTRSCVRGLCLGKGADSACCLQPLTSGTEQPKK